MRTPDRFLSMICIEVPPAFKGEDSLVNFNLAVDEKVLNIALDLFAIAFPDYRVAPIKDIYMRAIVHSDGTYRSWRVLPAPGYDHKIILNIAFLGQDL
jgi:hypothetical protein